jgi:hypothetical protein
LHSEYNKQMAALYQESAWSEERRLREDREARYQYMEAQLIELSKSVKAAHWATVTQAAAGIREGAAKLELMDNRLQQLAGLIDSAESIDQHLERIEKK